MRVLVCLNRDLASHAALNRLLPSLRGHEVAFVLSERVGAVATDGPWQREELRHAEQVLPNEHWFPMIEKAALPDDGRRWLTFLEIERLRGIPRLELGNPNEAHGLAMLKAYAPDVIVTVRYGHILKAQAIAVPHLGIVNLHSGLLPNYRGVLATFRALMNGDEEIGCTAHWITDGTIDTGDVIGTARIPVRRDRSLFWHVLSLYEPGTALLAGILSTLAAGNRPHSTRQPSGGAYFTYPTPEEWNEFTRAGWNVAQMRDLAEIWSRDLD